MSALIKHKPDDYTEEKLLNDLNSALDYYKKKDNIQC